VVSFKNSYTHEGKGEASAIHDFPNFTGKRAGKGGEKKGAKELFAFLEKPLVGGRKEKKNGEEKIYMIRYCHQGEKKQTGEKKEKKKKKERIKRSS